MNMGDRRATRSLLTLGMLLGACAGSAAAQRYDAYQTLRGTLVATSATPTGARGRYVLSAVRLTSSTGLVATGQMLEPEGSGPFPAVLLNDGREMDSRALEALPADFGDVVVLSLDYPSALPYEVSVSGMLFHGGRFRRAARLIPASFSLGAEFLAMRPNVDSTRIAIAATSFAVPFATIAAAFDQRFRNVALIYGAGDFASVMAANLSMRPRVLRRPAAWMATRSFREFEPERHAAAIAPRPLIMVNGVDDPQMPVRSVQRLFDAAREPKTIVWLRTGHLMPTDTVLIHALVDTALARLPVLDRARSRPLVGTGTARAVPDR